MGDSARHVRSFCTLWRRRRRKSGPTRTILPGNEQRPSMQAAPRTGPSGDELRVRALLRFLTGGER